MPAVDPRDGDPTVHVLRLPELEGGDRAVASEAVLQVPKVHHHLMAARRSAEERRKARGGFVHQAAQRKVGRPG